MASNFLSRIIESKQQEIEAARKKIPEGPLRAEALKPRERRPFEQRLAAPGSYGANIIAEIKRASPSKGALRADLDPQHYAKAYERGGAAAISVLTDRPFFAGGPEDLRDVRLAVGLPVLRKDFILAPYQLYESVVMGADAVLLIVRVLSPEQLKDYLALCRELQLDALVEVHSLDDLDTATRAGARLIGINNRDLSSFRTDLQNSVDIARHMHDGQVAVAASGIHERAQIEKLLEAGIRNFLVGESLVKALDPERFLKTLLGQ